MCWTCLHPCERFRRVCFISHFHRVQQTNHSPADTQRLVKPRRLSCASKPSELKLKNLHSLISARSKSIPFVHPGLSSRSEAHLLEAETTCTRGFVLRGRANYQLSQHLFPQPKSRVHSVWNLLAIKRHQWGTPWATQICFIHSSK